jgi:hypothetical protein
MTPRRKPAVPRRSTGFAVYAEESSPRRKSLPIFSIRRPESTTET